MMKKIKKLYNIIHFEYLLFKDDLFFAIFSLLMVLIPESFAIIAFLKENYILSAINIFIFIIMSIFALHSLISFDHDDLKYKKLMY
jgi:hypothetical protein